MKYLPSGVNLTPVTSSVDSIFSYKLSLTAPVDGLWTRFQNLIELSPDALAMSNSPLAFLIYGLVCIASSHISFLCALSISWINFPWFMSNSIKSPSFEPSTTNLLPGSISAQRILVWTIFCLRSILREFLAALKSTDQILTESKLCVTIM